MGSNLGNLIFSISGSLAAALRVLPPVLCWTYFSIFKKQKNLFNKKTIWDLEGRPRGQKMKFPRFDPIILRSFLVAIQWSRPRNDSSKQMMVYDEITFLNKTFDFSFSVFFLISFVNSPLTPRQTLNFSSHKRQYKLPLFCGHDNHI